MQFTHFSVKEFLSLATSPRVASYLARSQSDQRMPTAESIFFILGHLTSLGMRLAVSTKVHRPLEFRNRRQIVLNHRILG